MRCQQCVVFYPVLYYDYATMQHLNCTGVKMTRYLIVCVCVCVCVCVSACVRACIHCYDISL
jgi:hypothetical protein